MKVVPTGVPTPETVLRLAMGRPPTLGGGRLVCFDGPAGSGKTTWASGVANLALGARVIHMDDLYPGWSGLSEVDAQLSGLLLPLSEGHSGSFRRYDWAAGRFAEEVAVDPVPLLVLEGVGSGAARFADLVTVLVWIEAPYDLRIERGVARDGDSFAPHWAQWAMDETALFAHERTRERADVLVDGAAPYPGGGSTSR